jgi:hypothetical protein
MRKIQTLHFEDERWRLKARLLDSIAVTTAWGSRETDYQQVHIEPMESEQHALKTAVSIVETKLKRGIRRIPLRPLPHKSLPNPISTFSAQSFRTPADSGPTSFLAAWRLPFRPTLPAALTPVLPAPAKDCPTCA